MSAPEWWLVLAGGTLLKNTRDSFEIAITGLRRHDQQALQLVAYLLLLISRRLAAIGTIGIDRRVLALAGSPLGVPCY